MSEDRSERPRAPVHGTSSVETSARESGRDRRREPRYSLEEPARIELDTWNDLVDLYTKDISHDGVFIQTSSPPPPRTLVGVHLLLPDGTGTVRFRGEVVHVLTPEQVGAEQAGFGVQFERLDENAREILRAIVAEAEAAASTPEAIGPAVRRLVSKRTASPPPAEAPQARVPASGAGLLTDKLTPSPGQHTLAGPSPAIAVEHQLRDSSASSKHRLLVEQAIGLVKTKRYEEAVAVLLRARVLRPDHTRTEVLLSFSQARQALAARDLPLARSHYEAVIRLDPDNIKAEKELLMLMAMMAARSGAGAGAEGEEQST